MWTHQDTLTNQAGAANARQVNKVKSVEAAGKKKHRLAQHTRAAATVSVPLSNIKQ